jgi:hypothetical protein
MLPFDGDCRSYIFCNGANGTKRFCPSGYGFFPEANGCQQLIDQPPVMDTPSCIPQPQGSSLLSLMQNTTTVTAAAAAAAAGGCGVICLCLRGALVL